MTQETIDVDRILADNRRLRDEWWKMHRQLESAKKAAAATPDGRRLARLTAADAEDDMQREALQKRLAEEADIVVGLGVCIKLNCRAWTVQHTVGIQTGAARMRLCAVNTDEHANQTAMYEVVGWEPACDPIYGKPESGWTAE